MKPRDVSVSNTQVSPDEILIHVTMKIRGTLKRDGDLVSEKSRKDSQKSFKKILEQVEFPYIGENNGDV